MKAKYLIALSVLVLLPASLTLGCTGANILNSPTPGPMVTQVVTDNSAPAPTDMPTITPSDIPALAPDVGGSSDLKETAGDDNSTAIGNGSSP